jgi:HAD superfamily phosphoserine phosphatase-like hydrolase
METVETRALSSAADTFIDSVLQLAPKVAAFDCDGTLWSGDAGESFFAWEVKNNIVPTEVSDAVHDRYAEYKAGLVSEDDMCAELVTMHKGMTEAALMEAATKFIIQAFPGKIFPEMHELVRRLHEQGCEIWAVSSSNEWVIRAGMQQFGIVPDRILAAKPELHNGIITGRMVRLPSGPGKAIALREVAKKNVDAAFGNSRWDTDMLALAQHAFAINSNPDLEQMALQRGWTIYFPEGTSSRLGA